MTLEISMRTRDGRAYAKGLYLDGKTIVKAGGKISTDFKGKESVELVRNNKEYVDPEGYIIRDCTFTSPSSAAQFVNGNISNGLRVWKVNGENLGRYLERMKKEKQVK